MSSLLTLGVLSGSAATLSDSDINKIEKIEEDNSDDIGIFFWNSGWFKDRVPNVTVATFRMNFP